MPILAIRLAVAHGRRWSKHGDGVLGLVSTIGYARTGYILAFSCLPVPSLEWSEGPSALNSAYLCIAEFCPASWHLPDHRPEESYERPYALARILLYGIPVDCITSQTLELRRVRRRQLCGCRLVRGCTDLSLFFAIVSRSKHNALL